MNDKPTDAQRAKEIRLAIDLLVTAAEQMEAGHKGQARMLILSASDLAINALAPRDGAPVPYD